MTKENQEITEKILKAWEETPEPEKHTPIDELAEKVLELIRKNPREVSFDTLVQVYSAANNLAIAVGTILPSRFQIGDFVLLKISEIPTRAIINGIHFYPGKVKYDLIITLADGSTTRLYNIDSINVHPNED